MRKVLAFEELLNISDPESDYGLKAAGMAKLINAVRSFAVGGVAICIPDGFATPTNQKLFSKEVEDAYIRLTASFRVPKIILARSSDPEEEPGAFESYPSLFIPKDPYGSFNRWLTAARKVRMSGARALIGQVLATDLTDFQYDSDTNLSPREITVKSFGGDLTGFVGNSTNIVMGDEPVIVACLGLPSKIVRGDHDVVMMYENGSGKQAVSLQHPYWANQYLDIQQKTIDVIPLEDPGRIKTMRFRCSAPLLMHESTSLPFYHTLDDKKDRRRFNPFDLLDLVREIKARIGKNIEMEGSVHQNKICLFQLREYEVPQKKNHCLSNVPEERLIFKSSKAFGFNRFHGNLLVSSELIDIPGDAIMLYVGDTYCRNLDSFSKYRQLVFGAHRADDLYAGMHTLGHTVQTIVRLEKKNVASVAIGGSYDKLLADASRYPPSKVEPFLQSSFIYKDVTVECDGTFAQIYFNS